MSKAKQKRIRKELDKYYQTGNYWEWLRSIEREGLRASYNQEWVEAWKKVVQRSFRLMKHLQEFFERSGSFKEVPDFPDLTLLRLLKQLMEGKEVHRELSALVGLSPPGNAFREKALSWKEGPFKEEKAERILTPMITQPGQIDKKNYDQLAVLIQGTDLSNPVRGLGEGMKRLRKVTGPGGLKKNLTDDKMRILEELDVDLLEISKKMPPNLFPVLIYPFLVQLAQFFELKSKKESYSLLSRVVSTIPFLFERLAGDKAQAIKGLLLGFQKTRLSSRAVSALAEQASKADFEGKISLLGQIRSLVQHQDSEELLALFQMVYQEVLRAIGEKAVHLNVRQKKELPLVLGPILKRDLDLLWQGGDTCGDFSQLAELMKAIGEIGCLDRKLALLALVGAEKGREKKLREMALKALEGKERPDREDIQWVLGFLDEEIFPYVGTLRPLTEFFAQEPSHLSFLAGYMMDRLEFYLVIGADRTHSRNPFLDPSDLFEFFQEDSQESKMMVAIARTELSAYKENSVFGRVLDYLKCFPKNVFTKEGYQKFLTILYEEGKDLSPFLTQLEDLNQKILLLGEVDPPRAVAADLKYLLYAKEEVLLKFIYEHLDALKRVPVKKIEEMISLMVDEIAHKDQGSFLIRLSNILSEKIQEGEKDAGLLKNRVLDMLVRINRRVR